MVGGGMFLPAFNSFGGLRNRGECEECCLLFPYPQLQGGGFGLLERGPVLDSQTSVAGCVRISEL